MTYIIIYNNPSLIICKFVLECGIAMLLVARRARAFSSSAGSWRAVLDSKARELQSARRGRLDDCGAAAAAGASCSAAP